MLLDQKKYMSAIPSCSKLSKTKTIGAEQKLCRRVGQKKHFL